MFEPHIGQQNIWDNKKRFNHIRTGRRWGKSVYEINRIIRSAAEDFQKLLAEGHPEKASLYPYWYVAPTYRQAKSIAWKYLKYYTPQEYIHKINESELKLVLVTGQEIELKGAEDPDKLRGVGLSGCVLDEYAFIRKSVWEQHIRPMLTDTGGWADFISTPNGYDHFYELEQYAKEHPEEWNTFHFTSLDNPYVVSEVKEIEREYMADENLRDVFEQEYLASYKRMAGLVYKSFRRDSNVRDFEIDSSWTFAISLDRGFRNPTAVNFMGISPEGTWYVFDEISMAGLTVPQLAPLIRQKMGSFHYSWQVMDSAQASDLVDLNKYGFRFIGVKKSTGIAKENWVLWGINRIRELLRVQPGTGQPQIIIHPRCEQTIFEFENYKLLEKIDGKNPAETPMKLNDHHMDGIRYAISQIDRRVERRANAPFKNKRILQFDEVTGRVI